MNMTPVANKYFDFLIDLGFKGPFEYYYVREIHTNYVKGNIVVNIMYDGGFFVWVIKTKKYIPELESGTKRLINLDYSEYRSYDLFDLDPGRHIYNSVEFNSQTEKDLWFFSKLLRDNSEILDGNFKEFNIFKYILKKTGIIKHRP